jgi:hypothetical protein
MFLLYTFGPILAKRKKSFIDFNVVIVVYNCVDKAFNLWINNEICITIKEKYLFHDLECIMRKIVI